MNSQSNEGADYDRWVDTRRDSCNLGYFQELDCCSTQNRKTNKKHLIKLEEMMMKLENKMDKMNGENKC